MGLIVQVSSNSQEPDWHCFASLPPGSATEVHAENIAMVEMGTIKHSAGGSMGNKGRRWLNIFGL
jgi:hypothetical protein